MTVPRDFAFPAVPIDDPLGAVPATGRQDRYAYSMRALGKNGMPPVIDVSGRPYRLVRTMKHDFFAATGFYEDEGGHRVVLKMGRTADFLGFPLDWLGQFLCRREVRFYRKLADLPNVPPVLGMVGKTGFVHDYVQGAPLSRDRPVPDGFFDQLQALMAELHRRGIAYVDANKPENILLGDDGRPHLIDFQISYDTTELWNTFINRAIVRKMQREDGYHVLKHKRKLRPDEMTEWELQQANRKSWFIRLHRFLTKPYFLIRRRTFKRLRETGRLLPEGSK